MPDERIDRALSKIRFRDEVPDEVVKRFEDVKCVLEAARDNRRMLRVALEYTMNSVELALRLLCDRLGFEEAMDKEKDQTLLNLLQWLHGRDYLPHRKVERPEDLPFSSMKETETDLPRKYEALRDIRNKWTHTRDARWFGWMFLRVIPQQVDFINRLYDAPERRQEERKERRRVNAHCTRLVSEGAALEVGGQRRLLHDVNMLHCDAREEPRTYYFAMWPIFELDPEPGEILEDHIPYLAKCTSVSLVRGSLSLETSGGTSILIDRNLGEEEERRLDEWTSEAESAGKGYGFFWYAPRNLRAFLLRLKPHPPVRMEELRWID
jgi:hypothetical protein